METRTIQQILIYKLIMNPMTGRTEDSDLIAWSTERESLINWYSNQLESKQYLDGGWRKTFKKESTLEWYNPLYDLLYNLEEINSYGQGIQEEWVNEEHIPSIESRFLRIM